MTAMIGQQAFHSIPAAQRAGHAVTDLVQALHELALATGTRRTVLLSCGFEEDLKLAASCPSLDVICAGHCHSDRYGPVRVGDTLVVKGRDDCEA
ncbi:hypothetical protein AB5L52_25465 [Streptomyces sp. CG4]|uniref:hypothetical protein n=1 Tax=Streptomyces sp. CG4 TaxID=408783 RepID=UPI0034E2B283